MFSKSRLALLGMASVVLAPAISHGAVIFSENMGTPASTTAIASNVFQNTSFTFSGTGDVRSTTPSSGYTGASGGGNVFLTNTSAGFFFQIAGINTTGYAPGSLSLGFGATKSGSTTNLTQLTVQYSTDGTNFNNLTFPASATTATWRAVALDTASNAALPISSTLTLKFINSTTTDQIRIDDVVLSGTAVPEPAMAGLLLPAGLLLTRRRRSAR